MTDQATSDGGMTVAYGGKRDKPTLAALEQKLQHDVAHGLEGHRGFRCYQCGMESMDPHPIYTHEQMVDTMQNRLLDWNEECDVMTRDHMNICPSGQALNQCKKEHWPLPEKPLLPLERIHLD